MKIFDRLKNIVLSKIDVVKTDTSKPNVAKSEIEIRNEEYLQYRNKINKDFEAKYDFNSIEGINAIPSIPENKSSGSIGSGVDKIEYFLRMKAGEHKTNGRMDLAIACLKKANEIMPNSKNMMWLRKDYMRLVEYLKKDGQYEEAEREEMKINNTIPDIDGIHLMAWEATLRNCKSLNTDLISFEPDGAVCAECAKYRNRVFSISGKDKRFPKLPDFILQNGCIHRNRVNYCCAQNFGAYFHGIRGLRNGADPIISSNRPYFDDRTKEEIESYDKFKSMYDMEQAQIQAREKNRIIYEKLRRYLPDAAPKSLGAFSRMKNTKSKNYLKLVEIAKEQGIIIDD